MGRIDCKEAHKAAVTANIEKYLGLKPVGAKLVPTFPGILSGALETGMTSVNGLAKKFETQATHVKKWQRQDSNLGRKKERQVIQFIAAKNGIGAPK